MAYLIDTSVWIALTFDMHPHHTVAKAAFQVSNATRPAVFCRATEQSFLRIATTPRVLLQYSLTGYTNQDAIDSLHHFLASPQVAYWNEPAGMEAIWFRLATCNRAAPKVWMDAYLAAFAISGDLQMVTLDRDFNSFAAHELNLLLISP